MAKAAVKPGRFWGYIRVSSDDQAENGQSLDAQKADMQEVYEREYKAKGYEFAGIVDDPAVSGTKKTFFSRPSGHLLSVKAERGDVIVCNRMDRAFRSTEDTYVTTAFFREKRVRMVFLDTNYDTDTMAGFIVFSCTAMFAEMERRIMAERSRISHREARRKGRRIGWPPWGSYFVRIKGRDHEVVDQAYLAVGDYIMRLREQGWSRQKISHYLNDHKMTRPSHRRKPQRWTARAVEMAIAGFEKAKRRMAAGELGPPGELPPGKAG